MDDAADEADTRLAPGTRFGRYEIRRLVGEGGFGAVYEAEQLEPLRRRVALKVLHDSMSANPQFAARFVREAQAAARVSHPSCATVLDVGTERGVAWLAMEFLEGEALDRRIEREGALGVAASVDVLVPVLSAVAAVHDAGIVHRDLKPANIFLARLRPGAVRPKLLDFGIAKVHAQGDGAAGDGLATRTGAFLGTPHYASPEQAEQSRAVDARSDQFALGVILYECLTGSRPWPDGPAFRVLHAVATAPIEPLRLRNPEVPAGLDAAVLRALSRDPARRFPDVRAFGRALLPFASEAVRAEWRDEFGADVPGPGDASLAFVQTDVAPSQGPAPRAEPAAAFPPTLAAPAPTPPPDVPPREPSKAPRRGRALGLVTAGVAVAAGLAVAALRNPAPVAAVAPRAAPASAYAVRVRATPDVASFELDGVAAGTGSLATTLPRDGRPHELRVSAPGHLTSVLTFRDAPPPEAVTLAPAPTPPFVAPLRPNVAAPAPAPREHHGRRPHGPARDAGAGVEGAAPADGIPNV